jgi:hypothetical protein
MTWQPPPRPDWVRAVNDGLVLPISEIAELPFERDALLAEARANLGLADGGISDFGDDLFLEPLDVLLPALEHEAELTVMGRWMTRRFILRFLEVRLQMTACLRDDPGVRDEEIREPLFVAGAPRTGTTILHALLAQDPTVRVPVGWELLRPVPPPDPATVSSDARIALADRELRLPALVTGELDAIHVYGGRQHKECVSSMSFAFRSEEFTARYNVPSYERWLRQCDMRPAYEMHRLVLQLLQRRYHDVRWVLKSPVHMHTVPTLLSVYPDARLAFTHRDPITILASVTSLVAMLRWAHSDAVDFADIGRYHERLYQGSLDRLVTWAEDGTLDPARVHHSYYQDFMTDPLPVVDTLYASFGRKLEPDTERAMRDYLAARPKDQHGAHSYSFADLGLDLDAERARFSRYQDFFSVPEEARAT